MRPNKKNLKIIDKMITQIESKGFVQDRYGNLKDRTGNSRYKFQKTSYRYEKRIDTKPVSWIKLNGHYYKDVKI